MEWLDQILAFLQSLWPLFQLHFPELAATILQVIGAAAILAKLLRAWFKDKQGKFWTWLFWLLDKFSLRR